MYAVFRITEPSEANRSRLEYGLDDNVLHFHCEQQGLKSETIEKCPSLRVASASVALRNAVSREIGAMITAAVRQEASGDLIKTLTDLRNADPPNPEDLTEVYRICQALLERYGVDRARSWSDDARIHTRLGRKLEKYRNQREKFQK